MPRPGKTAARGYGARHKQERAKWKPQVEAGTAWCWRCGEWIDPSGPWDLGHDDNDRSFYRGPEHVTCNRATTGRRAKAMRKRWVL